MYIHFTVWKQTTDVKLTSILNSNTWNKFNCGQTNEFWLLKMLLINYLFTNPIFNISNQNWIFSVQFDPEFLKVTSEQCSKVSFKCDVKEIMKYWVTFEIIRLEFKRTLLIEIYVEKTINPVKELIFNDLEGPIYLWMYLNKTHLYNFLLCYQVI